MFNFSGVAVRIGLATILRDVDLAVSPGESVGLFGANGAGKTTLLRVIATLLRPSGGEAHVLGVDLASQERFDLRSRIGLIGHSPGAVSRAESRRQPRVCGPDRRCADCCGPGRS